MRLFRLGSAGGRLAPVLILSVAYLYLSCGGGRDALKVLSTALQVSTRSLPVGIPTVPYHATVLGVGGTPPYKWNLVTGTLPAGLNLDAAGLISGIPTTTETGNFTVNVTDSAPTPASAQGTLALSISNGPDGPAALPQVFIDTTFPDTSGYSEIILPNGGNFQAALNSATCSPTGTVIRLAAGATYTGNFTLPAKTCAAGQWIIIRTDTADSNLPGPDTRIDPTFSPVLAKIFSNNSSPAILTVPNANHYWFMGVEIGITPTAALAPLTENFNVILVGSGETSASLVPVHIFFDRCYVHGGNAQYARRGFAANGAFLAVVNSYFENFHVTGEDNEAIMSWNAPGPVKIVNNFLEASSEVILLGGADPSIPNNVPSDIEIRRNHFFKPLTWKIGDPSYAGIPWQVKNLLELKNAQRVLVEGNVMEHNWLQAQVGFGVVVTPRNQGNTCPWCSVNDITFRYNILRHAGSGIEVAGEDANISHTTGSLPSKRVSIHDNLITDINGLTWGGSGTLYLVTNGGVTATLLPPTDITINHNTGFQSGNILTLGDERNNPILNFILTNNISPHNQFGIIGSGFGVGNSSIAAYLSTPVISDNVIEGLPNGTTPSDYPPGNFFPANFDPAIGFVDFTGGDFRLLPTSPFAGAGTDGRDIGADVNAVNSATAGATP